MHQYRLFKWNKMSNLLFLGEEEDSGDFSPGDSFAYDDLSGERKDWIISEILFPNPRFIVKPNGTIYYPDPIMILKPKE